MTANKDVSSVPVNARALANCVFLVGLIWAISAVAVAQQPLLPAAAPPELKIGDAVVTLDRCVLQNGQTTTPVPKGVQLRVIDVQGDWVGCAVFIDDKKENGWIKKSLLAKAPPAGGRDFKPGDAVVTLQNTTLRLGQQVVGEVPKGARFEVQAVKGDWVGVLGIVGGRQQDGWLEKRLLTVVNAIPPTGGPPASEPGGPSARTEPPRAAGNTGDKPQTETPPDSRSVEIARVALQEENRLLESLMQIGAGRQYVIPQIRPMGKGTVAGRICMIGRGELPVARNTAERVGEGTVLESIRPALPGADINLMKGSMGMMLNLNQGTFDMNTAAYSAGALWKKIPLLIGGQGLDGSLGVAFVRDVRLGGLYENDGNLMFDYIDVSDGRAALCPAGTPGSVHRLIGEIAIGNWTFFGEKDVARPLTFVLTKEGYVYLRGKGKVRLPNGTTVQLGEKPVEPPAKADNAHASAGPATSSGDGAKGILVKPRDPETAAAPTPGPAFGGAGPALRPPAPPAAGPLPVASGAAPVPMAPRQVEQKNPADDDKNAANRHEPAGPDSPAKAAAKGEDVRSEKRLSSLLPWVLSLGGGCVVIVGVVYTVRRARRRRQTPVVSTAPARQSPTIVSRPPQPSPPRQAAPARISPVDHGLIDLSDTADEAVIVTQRKPAAAKPVFGGNAELRGYVMHASGISRLGLNITCFIGVFIFGWLLAMVFDLLGKGKKGWMYVVPIIILAIMAKQGEPGLAILPLVIYMVGWIHANLVLSHYRRLARQRIATIDDQETVPTEDLLEEGLLFSKVLSDKQSARQALIAALSRPDGGSADLFNRAGVAILAARQPADAIKFFDRALSLSTNSAEAEQIKKNRAVAVKKANK